MSRLWHEVLVLADFMRIYFWFGIGPYILQWLTVEVVSG